MMLAKQMLHRGIGIAQSLKQRLQISMPRVVSITGGLLHIDPVTRMATTQGIPLALLASDLSMKPSLVQASKALHSPA